MIRFQLQLCRFLGTSRGAATEDFARVVENDLLRSGQFAPVSRLDMLSFPSTEEEVFFVTGEF